MSAPYYHVQAIKGIFWPRHHEQKVPYITIRRG